MVVVVARVVAGRRRSAAERWDARDCAQHPLLGILRVNWPGCHGVLPSKNSQDLHPVREAAKSGTANAGSRIIGRNRHDAQLSDPAPIAIVFLSGIIPLSRRPTSSVVWR